MYNRLIQHEHVMTAINFVQGFFKLGKVSFTGKAGAVVFRTRYCLDRIAKGVSGLEQYDRKDDRLE